MTQRMTEKEKKNYERYLRELINGAIYKYPAFGNLVTFIPRKIVIDETFPNEVAGTDGESLRIFPKFFTEYEPEEQAFILLHEVLHVVQSHPKRAKNLIESKDRVLWNIVTDCIINYALGYGNENKTKDVNDLKVPKIIVGYPELNKLVGQTVPVTRNQGGSKKDWNAESLFNYVKKIIDNSEDKDDINNALSKLGKGKPQSLGIGNREITEKEYEQISGALGDLSTDDFNDPKPEHLEDEELPDGGEGAISDIIWSKRVEQAAGRDPSGILKSILGDLPKPKPDWRKELRTIIGNKLLPLPKTNWRRPSRRTLSGVVDHFEPARGRDRGCKQIICFHDTSGSCWHPDTIKEFLANIQAIQELKKTHLTYIMFDAAIQKVHEIPYSASNTLMDMFKNNSLRIKGGGGTSFNPVINWINDKGKEADVAIMLTDTYAPMPDEKPCVPFVWAVIDNQDFIPPFGKSVFIEDPPQGY